MWWSNPRHNYEIAVELYEQAKRLPWWSVERWVLMRAQRRAWS